MQDAFGGIVNIVLIALFLVIVEGILGMTINYTKAFRMKNYVLTAAENYEASACFGATSDSACLNRIKEDAKKIGYKPANLRCPRDYTADPSRLFCWKQMSSSTRNSTHHYSKNPIYYRIITQVDIHIPIIREIMSLEFFQVKGDTRVIEVPN